MIGYIHLDVAKAEEKTPCTILLEVSFCSVQDKYLMRRLQSMNRFDCLLAVRIYVICGFIINEHINSDIANARRPCTTCLGTEVELWEQLPY